MRPKNRCLAWKKQKTIIKTFGFGIDFVTLNLITKTKQLRMARRILISRVPSSTSTCQKNFSVFENRFPIKNSSHRNFLFAIAVFRSSLSTSQSSAPGAKAAPEPRVITNYKIVKCVGKTIHF